MRVIATGATDIGRKRKVNQDAFRVVNDHSFFVVADGMGGHAGGELASKITVETIVEYLTDEQDQSKNLTPRDLIIGAIHRANSAVYNRALEDPKLRGMGTTCIVMFLVGDTLHIGHVGDSRVYFIKQNEIWQLTKDHSLVNEKFKAGLITREQMRSDKSRNVITRSVGFESSVLADIYMKKVEPGDYYIACSDGLSGMIDDDKILTTTYDQLGKTQDLDKTVIKLIDLANESGGDDNITVVLAHIVAS